MVQTSTIVTWSAATIATGLLGMSYGPPSTILASTAAAIAESLTLTLPKQTGYAIYFDHRRRANPNFRREMRRAERRQARAEKDEVVAATMAARKDIHLAVDEAAEEGFPEGVNEREPYFMDHVQLGETLATDPSKTLEAALAFYKALKVYPTPADLIQIYDKTVPKRIIDVLAEMIAYDKDLDVEGPPQASGPNLENLSAPGLD
ncbi:mitochondrial import receptor subunit tom-20 [Xylariomycetidae sp. FL2044]|nr:mitochondrial import receptor subunit tom-20 [Xylariomycetidae sp. FL2044]